MFSKSFTLLVLLYFLKFVSGRSFTIVLDTTQSMDLEVDVIRGNVQSVTGILANRTEFENYILVPFNDQDTITPMVTTKPSQLVEMLTDLRVGGGSECPEDSLPAIQRALQISQRESYIYLFTNANAKYAHKLKEIEGLCRETGSRVVIFLSGSCSPQDPGGAGYIDVYYNIARACSGTVFRIAAVNLRKAFRYIKETTYTDYNDVKNYNAFRGMMQFNFTVDALTTDVLVVLSGEYPVIEIYDAGEYSPEMEKMLDTRQSLVVCVSHLKPGIYRLVAMSQSTAHLTFYKRNRLQFLYGFSPKLPNSLAETTLRPIPGRNNYIFIQVQENENIQINEVEVEFIGSNLKKRFILQKHSYRVGCYVAYLMVESQWSFRMTIIGKDKKSYQDVMGSTQIIEVQNSGQRAPWSAPTTEILKPDTTLIDYGTNATLVCKVVGYPKPTIWWEDDKENTLPSEEILLEIPSVHLSFVNITAMSNFTLYCKAKNAENKDSSSIELFVNRPYTFEVIQAPADQAIEYGAEGKLFCEVKAYPEAEIKWYQNGTVVDYNDNIYINSEEHTLEIKNMTLDDAGNYTCEVSNEANRVVLSAEVTVDGLAAPEISIPDEMIQKPEDWMNIECSINRGNPAPIVTWEYRRSYDEEFSTTLPSEVIAEDNKLKFSSVTVEHGGIYKCIAVNMMGEDSGEVTLKVHYPPKILNSDNTSITVIEGNSVELPCEVDAIPKPTVRWEMYQDDVIRNLPERHTTNDQHTHRFYALKEDAGSYHCIAENEMGSAEKVVTVDVFVPPYIDKPVSKEVTAVTGSRVQFECNVSYGNPPPTSMWEFIALDSTVTVLLRGTSNSTTLLLDRVTKANEGLYLCIAENNVGNDRIRIRMRVV